MPEAVTPGLERFVEAQAPVYAAVLRELGAGRKTSHWMWFVFPQLRSLGRSATAKFYGLEGREEASAYWQHPLLGARARGVHPPRPRQRRAGPRTRSSARPTT